MSDYENLLMMCLMINDNLKINHDHVTTTLSMNQVEDFRELVNRLWWKENGWVEK